MHPTRLQRRRSSRSPADGSAAALPRRRSIHRSSATTLPSRSADSSTCGALPSGISPTEKISITVRVFLNHDGTVAEAPELLDANPSTEQQTLMQNFVSGLRKCQPYTMLPQDQYGQWKTLDLVVHPHNYSAQ